MGMVRPGGRRAASLPGVMVLALGLANLVACGTTAPAESERLMAQAKAALDGGDAAAADRFLATILERDPADIPALVSRAKLHVREGRFVQAAEIYSRLARLRPQNGLYALRAGSFLKTAGKLRDARTFLERAVRQRPDDPDALYRLGASEFTAGAFAAAVELLARARAVAPRRADIAIKLAQALEQSGETTQALGVMDAIIEIRPEDTFLHFVRGLIRSRGGRYDGAIADLEIVVRDDPDLHRAHYALARALLASGRTGAGRAEMERFIAADEQRRREETALSAARLAGASSDDSPVLFRRRMEGLVQADPTSAEANRQLALAYSREGDDQMAEITFARASRLDPQDVKSRRLRGQLLLRMDRAAEAVTPLVEAARLAPDDETIRRLLVTARREASAAGRTNSP